jgi:hypothetical protein
MPYLIPWVLLLAGVLGACAKQESAGTDRAATPPAGYAQGAGAAADTSVGQQAARAEAGAANASASSATDAASNAAAAAPRPVNPAVLKTPVTAEHAQLRVDPARSGAASGGGSDSSGSGRTQDGPIDDSHEGGTRAVPASPPPKD